MNRHLKYKKEPRKKLVKLHKSDSIRIQIKSKSAYPRKPILVSNERSLFGQEQDTFSARLDKSKYDF